MCEALCFLSRLHDRIGQESRLPLLWRLLPCHRAMKQGGSRRGRVERSTGTG